MQEAKVFCLFYDCYSGHDFTQVREVILVGKAIYILICFHKGGQFIGLDDNTFSPVVFDAEFKFTHALDESDLPL